MATLIAYISFAITFLAIYKTYAAIPERVELLGPSHSVADFFIRSIAGFTEPDPIEWFPKLSIGKVLALIWTMSSTFIIFFYMSNLRANLVSTDYEPLIRTPRDLLERVGTIYANDLTLRLKQVFILIKALHHCKSFRKESLPSLKAIYEAQSYTEIEAIVMKISEDVEKNYYSYVENQGLIPEDRAIDVYDNRAAFICSYELYYM